MWTDNETLDKLRSKAAASSTGVVGVTIEELNSILPIKRDAHFVVAECTGAEIGPHLNRALMSGEGRLNLYTLADGFVAEVEWLGNEMKGCGVTPHDALNELDAMLWGFFSHNNLLE